MSDKCKRCEKTVYLNDKPMRIAGNVYHNTCFTCAKTGIKLTLRTATIGNLEDGSKDVFNSGSEAKSSMGPASTPHNPYHKPKQVVDVITERVAVVPDSHFQTTDRTFNIGGKQVHKGATGGKDLGSTYGVVRCFCLSFPSSFPLHSHLIVFSVALRPFHAPRTCAALHRVRGFLDKLFLLEDAIPFAGTRVLASNQHWKPAQCNSIE
jgi:hypothetical protein